MGTKYSIGLSKRYYKGMTKKKYEYETIDDFAGKLDWEGGMFGLASYGCEPSEIKDPKLRKLWTNFLKHFLPAEQIANQIQEYIDEVQ